MALCVGEPTAVHIAATSWVANISQAGRRVAIDSNEPTGSKPEAENVRRDVCTSPALMRS